MHAPESLIDILLFPEVWMHAPCTCKKPVHHGVHLPSPETPKNLPCASQCVRYFLCSVLLVRTLPCRSGNGTMVCFPHYCKAVHRCMLLCEICMQSPSSGVAERMIVADCAERALASLYQCFLAISVLT